MLKTFIDDFRFALRQGLRRPTASLLALSILALGIGANTAIFSVARGVLLRPLPYEAPEKLTLMWPETRLSPEMLEFFQDGTRVFDGLTGYSATSRSLTEPGVQPVSVQVAGVAANHFEVLGVEPRLGRGFSTEDAQPGGQRVVVLGAGFWRSRYGADPSVLGRPMTLDDELYTVVGVLPDGHRPLGEGWQIWTPIPMDRASREYCCSRHLSMAGRLSEGVALDLAVQDIRRVADDLHQEKPRHVSKKKAAAATVTGLQESLVANARPRILLLGAAVLGVLLAACANLANLQLSQLSARRRELAVRAALGASRRRVVLQLMTESLLLGALGGLAGLAVAAGVLQALVSLLGDDLPAGAVIRLDLPVLLFTLALSLLAAAGFGLLPALRAGVQSERSLRTRGADTSGHRLRQALVVAQVAAALLLLLGAGLLARSLWNLSRVDPGFSPEGVMTARVSPSSARHADPDSQQAFYDQLSERLGSFAGVERVAFTGSLPLTADSVWIFPFVPPSGPGDADLPITRVSLISDGYFGTLDIPLLAGGVFEKEVPGTRSAVIVNESFAARYLEATSPEAAIGQAIHVFSEMGPRLEVLGVVGDVHQDGLGSPPEPEIFLPQVQWPQRDMFLAIRLEGESDDAAASRISADLAATIRGLDDRAVLSAVRPMTDSLRGATASERSLFWLVAAFAVQALLLGAAGIYGVTAGMVTERRADIGVRLALGAQRGQVVRSVVGRAVALAGAGALLGLVTASVSGRVMTGLLHGVEPTDLATAAAVSGLVVMVAAIAAWRPARRAGALDPATVLRPE